MYTRTFIVRTVIFSGTLASAFLFAQTKPPVPSAPGVHEFPVTMRQNVVAGKTPVGTKVEAKLTIATLVDGTVVPMGATFSGEVVESAPKSATDPSRLAIRMDSVQWKTGSAPVKVYLTAWYYPVRMATDEGRSDDSLAAQLSRNRNGTYNSNSGATQPFPVPPAPTGSDAPPSTSTNISSNRAVMKDVESTRQSDGALALTSTRFNIKLDKSTTYVLATGGLAPTK